MRKRSTEILQKIIKEDRRRYSIVQLSEKYHVTKKTLLNDLKEMNVFLKDIGIPVVNAKDGFLEISPEFDGKIVREHLNKMDAYIYKLSPMERQTYILVYMLNQESYITMHKLAEELFVNRMTILNDLENVKKDLGKRGMKVISDAGKGIRLDCNEKTKIELFVEVFQSITIHVENDGFFQKMILDMLNFKFSFAEIFSYLQEYTTLNNMNFIDEKFYEIVLYCFTLFNLIVDKTRNEKLVDADTNLDEMEYLIVYVSFCVGIPITEDEARNFGIYLKEHGLSTYVKSIDEIELYKKISAFLKNIDDETNLELSKDSILIDALLMHIKSMKEWGAFDVEIPKDYEFYIDYDELELLVEKNCTILEDFLHYSLTTNMKKSIVIHICVAIIRNHRYTPQLSVAIICPGSMATGKYLEAQIKNYFDFHIVGVFSANQALEILEELHENVDMVLSTVSILSDHYKILKVNPFLTMDDMNMIQRESYLYQKNIQAFQINEQKRRFIDSVKDVAKQYGISQDLSCKMERMIIEYETPPKQNYKSRIGELLERDYVCVYDQKMDWRLAMRKSAEKLEKNGYIDGQYIEVAIENVEKYGDYIVISPGVALAHAKKDYGVYKDGLSLLVSKTGISFPEGNSKVHLLFCFASTGEKSYLNLLKEIIEIGKNQKRMNMLLEMNEEEIYSNLIGE